ncbi:MAG TPA: hypothetical protein VFO58_07280 [Vicinamibacterales bacterium]|nr:hypothetical protein [Vicinamibacterales bacterium]
MPWNSLTFMKQLDACGNRYEAENAWYTKKQWGEQVKYMLNAWNLYRSASTNALGMLLLGDGKIRKDAALLGNFGITSVGGAWDPEEQKLVKELEAKRGQMRTAPGLQDAPKVQGQGSVLSDIGWTPLMNDAYILGGTHGLHEFHLALEDAKDPNKPELKTLAHDFALTRETDPVKRWQSFFQSKLDMFWDPRWNSPRVLSRELIGLDMCGYEPQFSLEQLSFASRGVDNATFSDYLDALISSGYRTKDKKALMDVLSQFLFKKPGLLSA